MGSGLDPSASEFVVYFANITSWSQRAQDYLKDSQSEFHGCDLAGLVEHHQSGPKLIEANKRLNKAGRKVNTLKLSRTSSTIEGPGHRGVWTMVRKHFHLRQCSLGDKAAVREPSVTI